MHPSLEKSLGKNCLHPNPHHHPVLQVHQLEYLEQLKEQKERTFNLVFTLNLHGYKLKDGLSIRCNNNPFFLNVKHKIKIIYIKQKRLIHNRFECFSK